MRPGSIFIARCRPPCTRRPVLHGHAPDAFGGDGEQKDVNFLNEGSVGELGPHSGDVCRKLVVSQVVDVTVVLIEVVTKVLRAAP